MDRLSIERVGGCITVTRWGEVAPDRPCALLLHGTGFVADVWLEVAPALAASHTVYAIDRRGHGRSQLPDASYHFIDFAFDLSAVITALELTRILGVGHSAGAADLLLCATLLPARLWAYVHHGFETLPDGRARLLCTPATETAMLRPIFEAMEQVYRGDDRGNPFGWLREIACPVRIATAEGSAPIYGEMAERCAALVPVASRWRFSGVGRCVAQEAPALVIEALDAFSAGG